MLLILYVFRLSSRIICEINSDNSSGSEFMFLTTFLRFKVNVVRQCEDAEPRRGATHSVYTGCWGSHGRAWWHRRWCCDHRCCVGQLKCVSPHREQQPLAMVNSFYSAPVHLYAVLTLKMRSTILLP